MYNRTLNITISNNLSISTIVLNFKLLKFNISLYGIIDDDRISEIYQNLADCLNNKDGKLEKRILKNLINGERIDYTEKK